VVDELLDIATERCTSASDVYLDQHAAGAGVEAGQSRMIESCPPASASSTLRVPRSSVSETSR
jgi:hypothetical protein